MPKTKSTKKVEAKTVSQPQPALRKQTAAQRIANLEQQCALMFNKHDILADEIDRLRTICEILAKRLNANITASKTGDQVKDIILEEGTKELIGKVDFLLERGIMVKDDKMKINDNTFIVGKEVDRKGNVVNPRLQFAIASVDKELGSHFLGKTTGDVISMKGSDIDFIITGIYEFVEQEDIEQAFAEEPPESEESHPEMNKQEVKPEEEKPKTVD